MTEIIRFIEFLLIIPLVRSRIPREKSLVTCSSMDATSPHHVNHRLSSTLERDLGLGSSFQVILLSSPIKSG